MRVRGTVRTTRCLAINQYLHSAAAVDSGQVQEVSEDMSDQSSVSSCLIVASSDLRSRIGPLNTVVGGARVEVSFTTWA